MNRKKIAIILFLGLSVFSLNLYAQEGGEENNEIGLELSLGVSAGDIISEPGLILKPGVTWDIMDSGFVLGIDTWDIALLPDPSWGEPESFEEFGFTPGDTFISVAVGNYNVFSIEDFQVVDGYIYQGLTFSAGEIDVAGVELREFYLQGTEVEFALAAVLGGSYEIPLGEKGTLAFGVDFNLGIYPSFEAGDIEGALAYTYQFARCSLGISLEPTIVMEDDPSLTLEPVITLGVIL